MRRPGSARGFLPTAVAWWGVWACVLTFAGDMPSGVVSWPTGKPAGIVGFDCILEEDSPLAGARAAMFLEYAVSPQAIAYDIVWAETCWGAIHFPVPPTGTSLYADDARFVVRQALNDVAWRHSLPATDRGVFTHTLGNYPIDESRFAFQEARARRLTTDDIPAFDEAAGPGSLGALLPERPGRRKTRISVTTMAADRIGFSVLTAMPDEHRRFEYDFQSERLASVLAGVSEVRVPVGGFRVEAKTPEFPDGVIIDRLPARYRAGGRVTLVEFGPQSIEGIDLDLPSRIRVGTQDREPGGADPLRRATMSNYRSLPEMPSADTIGSRFTTDPLFGREQTFRKLTAQHWNRPVAAVEPADVAWLRTFADDCLRMAHDEPRLPIRLKLLFMTIASDLMLGNDSRVDSESLPSYLQALRDGGFGVIAEIAASQVADIRANWGRVQADSEE